MAASKPTFVLVPGAWHSPDSFGPTTNLLKKAGYPVHGIHLPSTGASPPHKTNEIDVAHIRSQISDILSAGKDIVLVMHSYGGTVGSEALTEYVQEIEKGTQKEGQGKVLRLVFCTAFCLPLGGSLGKALGGKPLPWFILNEDETIVSPGTPKEILYNDISDEVAAPLIAQLRPLGYGTYFTEMTVEPWKVIPSTFILCSEDRAIPLFAQEGMIKQAQEIAPSSFDVVERCDAGHSPFVSQPEWLAEKLVKAAGSA
ncbi:hypothetical protein PVAG01_09831 [Phlyctema vagabunda]|uniref:AB hydrolase-1 domain-containing protein n=1 Tax=Phlyctema vagabunda TaxID=108571 RepID=A0ABR4P4U6_9HELO